jgi:hypothetical protein
VSRREGVEPFSDDVDLRDESVERGIVARLCASLTATCAGPVATASWILGVNALAETFLSASDLFKILARYLQNGGGGVDL